MNDDLQRLGGLWGAHGALGALTMLSMAVDATSEANLSLVWSLFGCAWLAVVSLFVVELWRLHRLDQEDATQPGEGLHLRIVRGGKSA